MATPGPQRAIAGVNLVERLSVGLYGELWRAQDGRRDLRALIVDAKLAAEPGFAQTLMDEARATLAGVHHRSVVGTVAIARDGQRLVVVTEPVLGGATLADLLAEARGKGGKLAAPIAAAVVRAVVDGLATIHALGLVHGAIHPRSIMIDADGVVRLGDLAVGRALSVTAARNVDAGSGLLRGLAGYLAPEIALGEAPGPAADVYATGAMLFAMLTGEVPPGTSNLSPAMERLVQRALDTDLHRRFANAIELQENLAEAIDDDHWEVGGAVDLARWVQESRVATAANLDEATEDLLASLADAVMEPTRRLPTLQGEGGTGTGETSMASGQTVVPSSALDHVLADLDEGSDVSDGGDTGDVAYTQVDPTRDDALHDPVSALIALDPSAAPTRVRDPSGPQTPVQIESRKRSSPGRDPSGPTSGGERHDSTPLPAPTPDAPGTITRSGGQVAETGRHKLVEKAAMAALLDLDAEAAPAPPRRAPIAPPLIEEPPPIARSGGMMWLWLVVVLGAAGALVWVVHNSGQVNASRQQQHDDEIAAARAAAAKKTADLTAELPDPGGIRVTSTPDGAAVWLMLGRTPLDSIGLPSGMVHELRVELDGYHAKDVDVGGRDWTTTPEGAAVAHVQTTMTVAGAKDAPLPAVPPKPDDALGAGLKVGRGVLHVESTPPNAAVWLLVGVTPQMDLEGIEAGRDYELRVVKDGFLPGYVTVKAEEWRNGGDPRLPLSAAPKLSAIERAVTLTAAPKGSGRR